LFDAPRFARNFEDALWGMWQSYQAKQEKAA
jgi:predicted O-linked N-acetylglucosamine transferase (SPINDLY family)